MHRITATIPALLLSACCVDALAQGQEGVTKDAILLGTSIPLTGPVAPSCSPVNDGAQAWFKQVNANGGVHGRKIESIVLDDAYKAPEALANARELVAKQVLAFFGGCGSIQPAAILPLAQQNSIPYLYPFAGNPELMTSKVTFALLPTYAQQYESLVEHLVKKDGGKVRIFAVLSDVPGTPEALAGLTRAATDSGGEFVGSAVVPPSATDYTPAALKIKSLRPDYVAINLSGAQSARFFNALKANDAYPSKFVIGGPVNLSASFLQPVMDVANNHMVATSMLTPPEDPRSKSCIDAIKKYYPDLAIDWFSLWGCATAQVTTTALTELGPQPTRAGLMKLMDGWRDKTASPLFPPLTFGGANRLGISSMSYVAIRDGQKMTVEGSFKLLPPPAGR